MVFFNVDKLLSKNTQYFLYNWSNIQYIHWRRKLFELYFSEFSEIKRDPATLQLWHYYTHKIRHVNSCRDSSWWNDQIVFSVKSRLQKNTRLVWGCLDRCNGVECFKREEWHSVSKQNRKDHKQILQSQGKYPGSNKKLWQSKWRQDQLLSQLKTIREHAAGNLGCKQGWMEVEHGWAWVQVVGEPNSRYGNR